MVFITVILLALLMLPHSREGRTEMILIPGQSVLVYLLSLISLMYLRTFAPLLLTRSLIPYGSLLEFLHLPLMVTVFLILKFIGNILPITKPRKNSHLQEPSLVTRHGCLLAQLVRLAAAEISLFQLPTKLEEHRKLISVFSLLSLHTIVR